MKIAILTRPGACFPNIISQGLAAMLNELKVENKIFDNSLPMLMRLLPLSEKPKRWHNTFQFRLRNKLKYYFTDKALIKELKNYNAIIISECYPNAFWKNYFAIEQFKKEYKGKIISYTEAPLNAAPLNRIRHLDINDHDESIYDFNLFVSNTMENKVILKVNQAEIGFNISIDKNLVPNRKKEFIAVIDFLQPGFEKYREVQINTLKKLGVKTVVLEGKYDISEIRQIYQQASIFFLSFPETIGLPIAECFACGTYIFAPNTMWPMAWQNENEKLPDCFQIYDNEVKLEMILKSLMQEYDLKSSPLLIFNTFLLNYKKFYDGNKYALSNLLKQIN